MEREHEAVSHRNPIVIVCVEVGQSKPVTATEYPGVPLVVAEELAGVLEGLVWEFQ